MQHLAYNSHYIAVGPMSINHVLTYVRALFGSFPQYEFHLFILQFSDDPFFVVDVEHIIKKYEKWKVELPRVEPYYGNYVAIQMYVGPSTYNQNNH